MPATTRHLSSEQRRLATVDAALALAGEGSPDEVTTGAIAARMGVTQPALFKHFPSKDAIWEAVMDWVADQLLANVERASRSSPSPLGALEAIFMAHAEFVSRHPGAPRILFSQLQRADDTAAKRTVRELLRRYVQRVRALVELGQARGEVSPETDPQAAADLFTGTLQGLVLSSLLASRPSRLRADAPKAFAIYRRGIGSRS